MTILREFSLGSLSERVQFNQVMAQTVIAQIAIAQIVIARIWISRLQSRSHFMAFELSS